MNYTKCLQKYYYIITLGKLSIFFFFKEICFIIQLTIYLSLGNSKVYGSKNTSIYYLVILANTNSESSLNIQFYYGYHILYGLYINIGTV